MGGGIVEQIPHHGHADDRNAGRWRGRFCRCRSGGYGPWRVGRCVRGKRRGGICRAGGSVLQEAGIDPQDSAAVKAHLDANGGTIAGQALTKGGIIGAVDVATMGIGGKLLRAPRALRLIAHSR